MKLPFILIFLFSHLLSIDKFPCTKSNLQGFKIIFSASDEKIFSKAINIAKYSECSLDFLNQNTYKNTIYKHLKSKDYNTLNASLDAIKLIQPISLNFLKNILQIAEDSFYVSNDFTHRNRYEAGEVEKKAFEILKTVKPFPKDLVDDILQKLESTNDNRRQFALKFLIEIKPQLLNFHINKINQLAYSENSYFAWEYLNDTKQVNSSLLSHVIKKNLPKLESKDYDIQSEAIYKLGKLNPLPESILNKIIQKLNSNNTSVRNSVFYVLGEITPTSSYIKKTIIKQLDSNDSYNQERALRSLSEIKQLKLDKQDIQKIIQKLDSPDKDIQYQALKALLNIKSLHLSENDILKIVQKLKISNFEISNEACDLLLKLKPNLSNILNSIFQILNDNHFNLTSENERNLLKFLRLKLFEDKILQLLNSNYKNKVFLLKALSTYGLNSTSLIKKIIEMYDKSIIPQSYLFDTVLAINKNASLDKALKDKIIILICTNILKVNEKEVLPTSNLLQWNANNSLTYLVNSLLLSNNTDDKIALIKTILLLSHGDHKYMKMWYNYLLNYSVKNNLNKEKSIEILKSYIALLKITNYKYTHRIIDFYANQIIINQRFTNEDLLILNELKNSLPNSMTENSINITINDINEFNKFKNYMLFVVILLLSYILFWLIIVFFYSRCKFIQVILNWSPKIIRVLLIKDILNILILFRFVRNRLLENSKVSLTSDGNIQNFNKDYYFKDIRIKSENGNINSIDYLLSETSPSMIIAHSGLGKTMLLRYLANNSNNIVVFLYAKNCNCGVEEALKRKLKGIFQEKNFIEALLNTRGIDFFIDGLNETDNSTREKVINFIEKYNNLRIFVSSQPIPNNFPNFISKYNLLPLSNNQIFLFLKSRYIKHNIKMLSSSEFAIACKDFVNHTFEITTKEISKIINNPMDLEMISELINKKIHPEILELQKQLYEIMSQEHHYLNGTPFNIQHISKMAYLMKLNNSNMIIEDSLEVDSMFRHRLIIKRDKVQYIFRHEKIMDFFIFQHFINNNDLQTTHIDDIRFIGVYIFLAKYLSDKDSEDLKNLLISNSAHKGEHMISDAFILKLEEKNTINT